MLMKETINKIQQHEKRAVTQVEIAQVVGTSNVSLNRRVNRKGSEWTSTELIKLVNHYGYYVIQESLHNVNIENKSDTFQDKVEIKYFEHPNLKTDIKNPLITSLWFDRELVENVWKKDPKNLRIIKMLGDKMDSGDYPLRNDDILIMDITETDPTISGIYVFTTNNDNYIFINNVNIKYDGSYRFTFFNSGKYPERVHSPEEIKKLDLKIVGKIIKNQSLTI